MATSRGLRCALRQVVGTRDSWPAAVDRREIRCAAIRRTHCARAQALGGADRFIRANDVDGTGKMIDASEGIRRGPTDAVRLGGPLTDPSGRNTVASGFTSAGERVVSASAAPGGGFSPHRGKQMANALGESRPSQVGFGAWFRTVRRIAPFLLSIVLVACASVASRPGVAVRAKAAVAASADCKLLEVHYINVGQGASTLIKGPDGTTVLFDIGNVDDGDEIADYLTSNGVPASPGVDYVILSHRHNDHYGGYKKLIARGYDVRIANLDSESSIPPSNSQPHYDWWEIAKSTTARRPTKIQVGGEIDLGCGATILVAAANGVLLDGRKFKILDDNDRSISLLIQYGDWSMTLDGDLGSGSDACTGTSTGQSGLQQEVMQALIDEGVVDPDFGVDVMHVAHHGSHSSSSPIYFNLAKPEVALISVGSDDGNYSHRHPRAVVVERVLLGPNRPGCVTAPPVAACFQTEDGRANTVVSNDCISGGDVIVRVDPESGYTVHGSNRVRTGTDAEMPSAPYEFAFDEWSDDGGFPTSAFLPFFDDIDNPVPVQNSPVPDADMTPAAPALTAFEEDLLKLCGAFGAPIADVSGRLAGVLNAHPEARDEIKSRLDASGVLLGEGEQFSTDLAELWTGEAGFEHVFCGERSSGNSIGGLHYVGRYFDLQRRGSGGIGQGNMESDGDQVFTMPVRARCNNATCAHGRKGYALHWDASDLLAHGTTAWFQFARPSGKEACTFTAEDGVAATFVYLNGMIRTFYPVVTPVAQNPPCDATDVPAAVLDTGTTTAVPAAAAPFATDEQECGE